MRTIHSAVACNLDAGMLSACLPLFQESSVEAIEWSFDALYKRQNIPDWFTQLIEVFGKSNRLVGHGVFFSLFSGKWHPEQEAWLKELKALSQQFTFDHITEHFGFMTGKDFHHGAPLSIPYSKTTLEIGRDRLKRIQNSCNCPVGLENLAFAYSSEEVKVHGAFLSELVEPVNGFIILDLHNLYCQLHNFDATFEELINLYPLKRVREIHISGGSWESSTNAPDQKVRRDTHDDAVPEEVFELLQKTIPLCTELKFVVMEQIGTALDNETRQEQFRKDFLRMKDIVKDACKKDSLDSTNNFLPAHNILADTIIESEELYAQQLELSDILETEQSYDAAKERLATSSLANTEWKVEHWTPYMLETALKIARKWKK